MKIISEILFGTIKESIWFMGNVVTGGNLECLFEQPIIKAAEEFVYVNKPLVDIYEEQVKALIAENIYLEKDIKWDISEDLKKLKQINDKKLELAEKKELLANYEMDCKNCYKEKQNMIKRLHKYKSSKQALIDWNSQLENRLNIQKKNLIWFKRTNMKILVEFRRYMD